MERKNQNRTPGQQSPNTSSKTAPLNAYHAGGSQQQHGQQQRPGGPKRSV